MRFQFSVKQKKITAIVLIILASINLIFQYFSYKNLQEDTLIKGKNFAIENTDSIGKDINKLLLKIEKATHNTIKEMTEIDDYSSLQLSQLCKDRTQSIPELLGVTISFEPTNGSGASGTTYIGMKIINGDGVSIEAKIEATLYSA